MAADSSKAVLEYISQQKRFHGKILPDEGRWVENKVPRFIAFV